jgi:hypothetical protein
MGGIQEWKNERNNSIIARVWAPTLAQNEWIHAFVSRPLPKSCVAIPDLLASVYVFCAPWHFLCILRKSNTYTEASKSGIATHDLGRGRETNAWIHSFWASVGAHTRAIIELFRSFFHSWIPPILNACNNSSALSHIQKSIGYRSDCCATPFSFYRWLRLLCLQYDMHKEHVLVRFPAVV